MKYYVVKKGRRVGIFNSWSKCEEQVKGFPNAVFKSFSSLEDAKKYYNDQAEVQKNTSIDNIDEDSAIAYVDGSYDSKEKRYGYGVIIFYRNKKEILSGAGDESELIEFRNVAGELKAVRKAIEYAIDNKIKTIYIHYDYAGIENWFIGEWKTNNNFTSEYANYAKSVKNIIDVRFVKVKAHTGDKYNEEVDKIAKLAIVSSLKSNSNIDVIDKLKASKVNKGKIEPVYNIITNDDFIVDTMEIINIFKEKWKRDKRKINEIEEVTIAVNIINREYVFKVKTDKENLVININFKEVR